MRSLYKLSARSIPGLGAGKHGDGGGLWLYKDDAGNGKWILRITVNGRRREMGLGSMEDRTLRQVREEADRWRAVAKSGLDPIREREKERREAVRNQHLLGDIAREAFEARKAELKGDGVNGRWFAPLALHVLPKLGRVPVAEIDQRDIRDVLAPIWHDKAETAQKALARLTICLRHEAALGLDVDLQAPEKAKALLGKQRHEEKHIPAMNWRDVPAFYASLSDGTITHLALRFLILTGARSGPVRQTRQDQIKGAVWTIPAAIMKGRVGTTADFSIPLSLEALAVLRQARPFAREGNLFPNVSGRGVISDMTMSKLMERRGLEARPHGFRSSLRDWLAEATDARREVAETILGHTVGGSVERAYRRTDFLEQRRPLMEAWARHVTGKTEDTETMKDEI